MTPRFTVDPEREDHDDELADFGGAVDAAVVAVTVAMHVAAISLLHRSAAAMKDRSAALGATRGLLDRLRRRGGAAIADGLVSHLEALGTNDFESPLRLAAEQASRRVSGAPRAQLVARIGREEASELAKLGPRACRVGGRLAPEEVAFLARHLEGGGELEVGLGRGRVFLRGGEARAFLRARAGRTELRVIAPPRMPRDAAWDRDREEWASVHSELMADPVLSDLVSDLFTRTGFDASTPVLRRLLELAPLIRRHERAARQLIERLPPRIDDTTTQILAPLTDALHGPTGKPTK